MSNSNQTPHGLRHSVVRGIRQKSIRRRRFLKASGVGLSLPLLDAMRPAFAATTDSDPTTKTKGSSGDNTPRRMFAICNNLGLIPDLFFPKKSGRDYELSPYLKIMEQHRENFTVFSGVSHPDIDSGHPADNCFLTAAPHPGGGGFKNTISLDQLIAEHIGHLTRFPSINLGVNTQGRPRSLAWTNSGVLIPCEESPSVVFKRLFMQGSSTDTQRQIKKLQLGESILDTVAGQAKQLQQGLGPRDAQRMDQYFSSVRELEKRMTMMEQWEDKPRPVVTDAVPTDATSPRQYMEKIRLMYDLARLAFETDSTRSIALMLDSVNSPAIDVENADITDGYHNLSHHGQSDAKLAQLRAIDEQHMHLLSDLYTQLSNVHEDGQSLLDRTMVLYGSNLGNANTHVNTNMPTLLAGGGLNHGQHLAFDQVRNYPLPNLYVSMLQRMGIEADRFGSSTGTMRGVELI